MRVTVYLILILFISCSVSAQHSVGFDTTLLLCMDKSYINTQRQLEIDNQGNKYIVGFFKDSIAFGANVLYHNSTNYQYSQAVFIAKYDSADNFLYCKKIAEGDSLISMAYKTDESLNQSIALNYKGILIHNTDTVISNGGADILILNLDLEANKRGSFNIGGDNNEVLNMNSISFFQDGSFYLTGGFNGTFSGTFLNYKLGIGVDTLTADKNDFFIARFDSNCNPLMALSYFNADSKGSGSIYFTDGFLYILGGITSNNSIIGGKSISFPSNYNAKMFIAKLDTLGNAIWIRKFGNEDQFASMGANALAVHGNRVYVGGSGFTNIQNKFHFEGGPTLNGNGASTEYYIASYDTAGTFKWNTIAKNFNEATIASIACDSASNVYVTGKFDTQLQFANDTLNTHGGQDVFVLSYDSAGTYRWGNNGGGAAGDRGDDIALDNNGKPWIVGGTISATCQFGNYNYTNPWNNAYFMASIDSVGFAVGVHDVLTDNSGLVLYPNPVRNELIIHVPKKSVTGFLHLYDMLGKVLAQYTLKESSLIINTSNIPSGIYFVRYTTDEESSTRKIIIEH